MGKQKENLGKENGLHENSGLVNGLVSVNSEFSPHQPERKKRIRMSVIVSVYVKAVYSYGCW